MPIAERPPHVSASQVGRHKPSLTRTSPYGWARRSTSLPRRTRPVLRQLRPRSESETARPAIGLSLARAGVRSRRRSLPRVLLRGLQLRRLRSRWRTLRPVSPTQSLFGFLSTSPAGGALTHHTF